jgi:hypothetical protein
MSDTEQGEDIPAIELVRALARTLVEETREFQERIAARRIQRTWRTFRASTRPVATIRPMAEETTTTLNINGLSVNVGTTERTVSDETEALYPKAERAKMDRKELNKFFKEACETTQTKYHLLDMKIEDPAKLRETYDLAMMINSTRLHHADFDMTDVFTV